MLKNNDLSLYFHYPFCLKKCFYCDFASLQGRDDERLQQSYFKSIQNHQDLLDNSNIKTLFFGGGTPSLISPKLLENIFKKLNLKNCEEISIEINPATADENKIKFFKDIGINRVSIGMQALNDKDLTALGRIHNLKQSLDMLHIVKKYFSNISLDFIYARPNQTLLEWEMELDNIIKLDVPHLSLYQLTIENGWNVTQPADNIIAQMFKINREKMANYQHYEISNYAISNQYQCLHNLAYWRYLPYLGIGPSAHSRINFNQALAYDYNINNWLDNPKFTTETLSNKDRFIEKLLMGLRLSEGVALSKQDYLFINKNNLQNLIKDNFIIQYQNKIIPTIKGTDFNDYVIKNLIL